MREYFVIRHRATAMLMPAEVKGGYTKWDPEDFRGIEYTPRLFLTEKGANTSAWWWSRGIAKKRFGSDDDGLGRTVTVQENGFEIREDPGRDISHLEVVRVEMHFKGRVPFQPSLPMSK